MWHMPVIDAWGNYVDFTDKRVLVTGSSRGIGFDIAKTFLDAGARVAINGSTEQSVGAAMERLDDGAHTIAAPGNIATVAGCELAVETATEAFGGLDILVNNAGVGAGRPIADCDEAMWDAHADVNLKGLFFCCRAAIPELQKSNGNIINIGSDGTTMAPTEGAIIRAISVAARVTFIAGSPFCEYHESE